MSESDEIAVVRTQFVERLNTVRAELESAKKSLPERKAAQEAERSRYERLNRRVMDPLRDSTGSLPSMPTIPSALHAWLEGEAKAPLIQAQTALRQIERQIESLAEDLSRWTYEIDFMDRILAGGTLSSVRLVVPRPKPPVVEFDDIVRERTA